MSALTDDQIKALWRKVAAKADFNRGRSWRTPIYRGLRDGYEYARNQDPAKLPPPEEMYVEFRLEPGAFGTAGSMGHRVTRVVANGRVVVEEVHHEDRPVFIPFDAFETPKAAASPKGPSAIAIDDEQLRR